MGLLPLSVEISTNGLDGSGSPKTIGTSTCFLPSMTTDSAKKQTPPAVKSFRTSLIIARANTKRMPGTDRKSPQIAVRPSLRGGGCSEQTATSVRGGNDAETAPLTYWRPNTTFPLTKTSHFAKIVGCGSLAGRRFRKLSQSIRIGKLRSAHGARSSEKLRGSTSQMSNERGVARTKLVPVSCSISRVTKAG